MVLQSRRYQKPAGFLDRFVQCRFPFKPDPRPTGGGSRPQQQAVIGISKRPLHEIQEVVARAIDIAIQNRMNARAFESAGNFIG